MGEGGSFPLRWLAGARSFSILCGAILAAGAFRLAWARLPRCWIKICCRKRLYGDYVIIHSHLGGRKWAKR